MLINWQNEKDFGYETMKIAQATLVKMRSNDFIYQTAYPFRRKK